MDVPFFFSQWYPVLADLTFRTAVVPLTRGLAEYFAEPDGLPLASESLPPSDFASLEAALAEVGGAALPKLCGAAPRDAAWMTHDKRLRVTGVDEACSLLRASDHCQHELARALDVDALAAGGAAADAAWAQYSGLEALVLRRWAEVRPAWEVRAFVVGGRLVGISQRHCGEHRAALEAAVREAEAGIAALLCGDGPVATHLGESSFAADIYLGRTGRLWLVDLAPAGDVYSDPLLFGSWAEVHNAAAREDGLVEHRMVEAGANPLLPTLVAAAGMPYDLRFLGLDDLVKQQQEQDGDDEPQEQDGDDELRSCCAGKPKRCCGAQPPVQPRGAHGNF